MSKQLNFNTVKKHYLTVTLADEKNTTLLIGMPTKAMVETLSALQDSIDVVNEDETNIEAMDDVYNACAELMSRNKVGVKITSDYLGKIFDFEDIVIFFNAYMDFVDEFAKSKN